LGVAAYRKVQTAPAGPEALAGDLTLEREIIALREYFTEEMTELKNLFWDLAHRQSLTEKWRDRPDVVGLYRALLSTGLAPQWAREFSEKSAESKDAWGGDLSEHLRKTIRPRLRVLSAETPLPRLVALTGPTGAGKTTALVRLAAWSQKKGRKVSAITLDTLKLGAVEQLARYARIMGLGLKACQNAAEFAEANEIFQESDLVLIDTNTRDFAQKGLADDLSASLITAGAKHLLVLPAGLKTEDLEYLHRTMVGPTLLGLILTKLDETMGLGNVLGFLASLGPPLGFFSIGPRTPEDFLPANADKLIDYWLAPLAAQVS
jgi:flagellar biosynthesis protein FlhF